MQKNPNVRFDYLKKSKVNDTYTTAELTVSYGPYLFTVLPDVCHYSFGTIEAVCSLLGIFSICRLVWPKIQGRSINYNLRDSHQLRDSALFKPDSIFYNKKGKISLKCGGRLDRLVSPCFQTRGWSEDYCRERGTWKCWGRSVSLVCSLARQSTMRHEAKCTPELWRGVPATRIKWRSRLLLMGPTWNHSIGCVKSSTTQLMSLTAKVVKLSGIFSKLQSERRNT